MKIRIDRVNITDGYVRGNSMKYIKMVDWKQKLCVIHHIHQLLLSNSAIGLYPCHNNYTKIYSIMTAICNIDGIITISIVILSSEYLIGLSEKYVVKVPLAYIYP